ncbi:MAG: class F sortase [Nocardioidaceae bacterium]
MTTGRVARQGMLYALALVVGVAGVVAIVFALSSQDAAPQEPRASGRIVVPPTTSSRPSTAAPPQRPPPATTTPAGPLTLVASSPSRIDIPAIGVHTDVISIGKNADGTLAVPQPGPDLNKVAWYDQSATPGAAGPAVLEGHVDTIEGPSIFYHLGALQPGNRIVVTRVDGSTAVFTVNAVRAYPTHADFPIAQIYGAQLSDPTLRLITCSNFDDSSGHYVGNTVVFAHLTDVRHS